MTKQEIEELWKKDFKQEPFQVSNEQEALEIAEVAVGFGIADETEALTDNRTIKQYLTNQFNRLTEKEISEREVLKQIEETKRKETEREAEEKTRLEKEAKRVEQEKIKFLEKERFKRITGLENEENLKKLKDRMAKVEYTEAMKVQLGLKEKFDKEDVKQKIREEAQRLKKDEQLDKEVKAWWLGEGQSEHRKNMKELGHPRYK